MIRFIYHRYIKRVIDQLFLFKWILLGDRLFKHDYKTRILYIAFINGGGLKKHVAELINGMTLYDTWLLSENNYILHNRNKFRTNLSVYEIIQKINPSIIHVHQLSKDLEEIDIIPWEKTIITMHDFYYVCPYFFMTSCFGKFCHPSNCSEEWRKRMHDILIKCKLIIVPSVAVRDIISIYYPDIVDKIKIIEHGIIC